MSLESPMKLSPAKFWKCEACATEYNVALMSAEMLESGDCGCGGNLYPICQELDCTKKAACFYPYPVSAWLCRKHRDEVDKELNS